MNIIEKIDKYLSENSITDFIENAIEEIKIMRKYVLPNDKKNFEAIIKQYIDKHNLDPKHGYTEEEALFKVGTFHLKKLMNALGKLNYNKKYYEELGF